MSLGRVLEKQERVIKEERNSAAAAAATAKSLQSCPTLRPQRRQPTRLPCPWDSPGKNTGVGCHCLLQCMKVKVKSLSRVRFLATPWTTAYQAPLSMGFARQEYWSGLPLPSPRNSRIFRFFNRSVTSIILDSKSWQLNILLVSNIDFSALPKKWHALQSS